jgi:retron-type reverse transcriptase
VGRSGSTDKSFVIPKQTVWEAWKRVRANKGAAGVDGRSIGEFESDLRNNLYKIWNRMSSGSYFPPPVKAVEIPKVGGTRTLGVPTVADRVAQTVVALQLEARTEAVFHPDSYGYRPRRSAHQALARCRERCWKKNWVIDLDIQKFFDSVPWDLVVKAVEANTDQKWVVLYVKRWLEAPLQLPDGTLVERDRGTPQGSAVSPVLANLFMHYAFDLWLAREFPTVEFERYCDDAVVHCATERQAREVLAALAVRMERARGEDGRGRAAAASRQDQDRVLQGRTAAWLVRAHLVHFPGVCVPLSGGQWYGRADVQLVHACGQSGGPQGDGSGGPPLADAPVGQQRPGRARRADQPDRGGLDELLRPVLPVTDDSPPSAH